MHTDGGYGNEALDKKMDEHEITHITTAIRGRKSEIEKTITQTSENEYIVSCPEQDIISTPTKKRNKVQFDIKKCKNCILNQRCSIYKNKGKYYFKHADYLRNNRNQNILNIPAERRKIRPNVEASMREFKVRAPNGKLKVRGLFKAKVYAYSTGISINFGRIFRYLIKKGVDINNIFDFINIFFGKNLFSKFYTRNFSRKNIYLDFLQNQTV